jgi:ubiquitin-conjugating enzyme E2 S
MQAASATNENISPKAMKAIMLEIRDLTKTPIDGVRVVLNEECVTDVQADIDGPGTF